MTGRVVSIKSGDVIELLVDNRTLSVCLYAVDCPEALQPFGIKAKKFTASLCLGKVVSVKFRNGESSGSLTGEVFLPNGTILNVELLKAGLAWHNSQYSHSPILAGFELKARRKRVGLWSDPAPVPPWEFRLKNKQASVSRAVSGSMLPESEGIIN